MIHSAIENNTNAHFTAVLQLNNRSMRLDLRLCALCAFACPKSEPFSTSEFFVEATRGSVGTLESHTRVPLGVHFFAGCAPVVFL